MGGRNEFDENKVTAFQSFDSLLPNRSLCCHATLLLKETGALRDDKKNGCGTE